MNRDTIIHLVAGGCGGTTGAVATCPLEVVKTRLQSSNTMGLTRPPSDVYGDRKPKSTSSASTTRPSTTKSSKHAIEHVSGSYRGGLKKDLLPNPSGSRWGVGGAWGFNHNTPAVTSLATSASQRGMVGSESFSIIRYFSTISGSSPSTSANPVSTNNYNYNYVDGSGKGSKLHTPIISRSDGTNHGPVHDSRNSNCRHVTVRAVSNITKNASCSTTLRAPNSFPLTPRAMILNNYCLINSNSIHIRAKLSALSSPTASYCGVAGRGETMSPHVSRRLSLWQCFRVIVQNEGLSALFKGLVPTILGVAPSRAIYFMTYSNAKKWTNQRTHHPDSALVHMSSAAFAGFVTCSATNPLWLVKTRLQLQATSSPGRWKIPECVYGVYKEHGFRGFYKGVTASYVGISETVIHFVIYEHLKSLVMDAYGSSDGSGDSGGQSKFLLFMLCGGTSKMIASSAAYPHEVARTRLREKGSRYTGFFNCIKTVAVEETWRGLYRGLSIHLIRQIPNTAVMMGTYETVVYLLSQSQDAMLEG